MNIYRMQGHANMRVGVGVWTNEEAKEAIKACS